MWVWYIGYMTDDIKVPTLQENKWMIINSFKVSRNFRCSINFLDTHKVNDVVAWCYWNIHHSNYSPNQSWFHEFIIRGWYHRYNSEYGGRCLLIAIILTMALRSHLVVGYLWTRFNQIYSRGLAKRPLSGKQTNFIVGDSRSPGSSKASCVKKSKFISSLWTRSAFWATVKVIRQSTPPAIMIEDW